MALPRITQEKPASARGSWPQPSGFLGGRHESLRHLEAQISPASGHPNFVHSGESQRLPGSDAVFFQYGPTRRHAWTHPATVGPERNNGEIAPAVHRNSRVGLLVPALLPTANTRPVLADKVFSHRVDFGDMRAAFQQGAVMLACRQALCRRRARRAARNRAEIRTRKRSSSAAKDLIENSARHFRNQPHRERVQRPRPSRCLHGTASTVARHH